MLTDKNKTYEAVLLLGQTTDTQDVTGTVLSTSEVTADRKQIEEAILSFIGEYDQLPPMYSAIKIGGKKLYELAREGKEVERNTRQVWIHNIQILQFDEKNHEVRIRVECSKGTYIRTLCHDIGAKLKCGGCMKSLLRTKVGQFTLMNSLKLSEISEKVLDGNLLNYCIPVDDMFSNYPKVTVKEEFCKYIYNGNSFYINHISEIINIENQTQVRVYDSLNTFIGIYEFNQIDQIFKPIKMFL
jgi:tRNA pseudouridine55 synthase